MPAHRRPALDEVADAYVRLALAIARHDPDYFDYCFAPAAWRRAAERGAPRPIDDLIAEVGDLLRRARRAGPSSRREFLLRQLAATEAFLRRRAGETRPLAEEMRQVYDTDLSLARQPVARLERLRRRFDAIVPGRGSLSSRLEAYQRRFLIPEERLERAIEACVPILRDRVARLARLPAGESVRWELVSGRPWDAYSFYQGRMRSLIQFNREVPRTASRLIEVLAHEMYPGHHTFAALIEERLVRARGWSEFTICPLHSPLAVVNEGMAKWASRAILTIPEKMALCRDLVAPVAGLKSADLDGRYASYLKACEPEDHVRTAASLAYLEGRLSSDEAVALLVRHGSSPAMARKTLEFARHFGAYTLNYVVGERIVGRAIGRGADRTRRYFRLLGRPLTPSGLLRRPSATT